MFPNKTKDLKSSGLLDYKTVLKDIMVQWRSWSIPKVTSSKLTFSSLRFNEFASMLKEKNFRTIFVHIAEKLMSDISKKVVLDKK